MKARNPIKISNFEVITREGKAIVQFDGKTIGTVSRCTGGYQVDQHGQWVFRAVSLRRVADFMEEEILKRMVTRK